MSVNLSPFAGAGAQIFDNNGVPLSGGLIYTYTAGTTTPQATYTTSAGSIANSNPIVLNASGRTADEIWLTAGVAYKFVLKDSLGVTIGTYDNISGINDVSALAGPTGSSQIGFIAAGSGAVSRTAQSKMRDWVSVKDFGATGDGATNDTAAINAAISSLTSGGTLLFPNGTYLCGELTVSNANVNFFMENGVVLSFPTLGANKNGISVNANNFKIMGGKLQGPATGVYVANENGIYMVGSSTSSRRSGLILENVEITAFGAHGVYGKFTDEIILDSCNFHDIGYAGAIFLSCNHGRATKNRFVNITPGTSSNMYGISLTHISTNYNTDPNAGTKQATNPFCWDWYIGANYVSDIAWEGIDCHGGYEITIDSNHVYATRQGIACSSSSGAAAGYAGWDNAVINNVVDARNQNGTASGYENQQYGINLNGGSTLNHKNVVCTGNIVYGHGILGNANSGAIQCVYMQNGNISNNIIQKWGGSCVVATASSGMVISGNTFLELGGSVVGGDNCIMMETVSSLGKTFSITNNRMSANGGTAGGVGVRAEYLTTLPFFAGNDFAAATSAPYALPADFLVSGVNSPLYRVTVSNAGGGAAESIDVSALSRYQTFRIEVASSNALSEIANFTNGVYGQIVTVYSPNSTAWKLNTTGFRLSGGTAFSATQYDIISVLQTGDTGGVGGVYWTETSRSVNA